jgi:hypothetical protein
MARESGGGGALGWTLLGFLAGIAATLGVQTLMSGSDRSSAAEEAVSSQVHITKAAPPSAPVKPVKKKIETLAATSSAPSAPTVQPSPEVEDDAAAAGMTSRVSTAPANNN